MIGPLTAHRFNVLVHVTTYSDLLELVTASGLQVDTILDDRGRVVSYEDQYPNAGNFTVVAQSVI